MATFHFIGPKVFYEKTKNWIYFHEILGLSTHLAAIEELKLPSPKLLNMQGPEALNATTGRMFHRLRKGLNSLGLPIGNLDKVPYPERSGELAHLLLRT